MTSTTVVEALWLRLQPILTGFAERLVAADPILIRNLGRTANDAFPLRAYLTFMRHPNGDEVAITVDVGSDGQRLTLESDVCTDQGRIIAVGPSTSIDLSENPSRIEDGIHGWLRAFEEFLMVNEAATASAVSQLA
jgi:hypothetical protein